MPTISWLHFFKRYQGLFIVSILLVLFGSGCARKEIGTNETMTPAQMRLIHSLGLLNKHEKISKFYSEYKAAVTGSFFTDKRIAHYWIDKRNDEENKVRYALYADVKSIDTVYHPADTYCPYAIITRKDGVSFQVFVNGEPGEVKAFFEEMIGNWKGKR